MKRKKIGIITFHNSYNCGSMLQSYALQKILSYYDLEIEIINFSNKGQKEIYSIFSKEKNFKGIIKNFIILFYYKKIKQIYNNYEIFKNHNFNLSSKTYSSITELSDVGYDTIVTGSDQVWNVTIKDGDDAYFLPWVKTAKKVAYSPSFGAKNILEVSKNPEKYKEWLNGFDAISIREKNGQNWIKELCGVEADILLDPTLLLEVEDYEKICDNDIFLPDSYIFYYSPGYNKKTNQLVNKISKKYNLPVIAFNSKNFYIKGLNFIYNFKLPTKEDPSVYLKLIKNSKLVITTSFHGTIFSSIFKKTFWTIKNGAMFKSDDRVLTLANTLDLEDRIISSDFDDGFNYLLKKDYSEYEKKLKQMQVKSKQFIEKNIVKGIFNNEEGK